MINKLMNFEGYVCPVCGAIADYDFTTYETHKNHGEYWGIPCVEELTTAYCPKCNEETDLEQFNIDNPLHLYYFAKANNLTFVPKRLENDEEKELDKAYKEVDLAEFLADNEDYIAEIEHRAIINDNTLVVYYYI